MNVTDYDSLLEQRGGGDQGVIAQHREAARLAEIARNLESLHRLAEAEAEEHETSTREP